jgi:hypothetical protein
MARVLATDLWEAALRFAAVGIFENPHPVMRLSTANARPDPSSIDSRSTGLEGVMSPGV